MMLALFNAAGAFVGYANFYEEEKLQSCRIRIKEERHSFSAEDFVLSKSESFFNDKGESFLQIKNAHSGETGFLQAFAGDMGQKGLYSVFFQEKERVDLWKEFLETGFAKETQAKYATALALWPKNDLKSWHKILVSVV